MTIDLSNELAKRFTGQHPSKLDDKRRTIIPAHMRAVIALRSPDRPKLLWITPDHRNKCNYLACFDTLRFSEIYEHIPGGNLEQCNLDNQNRIMLPQRFVTMGGLENCMESNSIVIAASPSMTHFEIWSKRAFDKGYHIELQGPKLYEL